MKENVMRGGNFRDHYRFCCPTYRGDWLIAGTPYQTFGFRIVIEVK